MSEREFKLVSRPLVMAASGWLLASWTVNLAIDSPLRITHDNMQPAVQWMMMSAVLGMGLVWPVCRLTFTRTPYAAARALSDAVVLLLVFQVVIWPLRVLVEWTVRQTVMVNLAIAVWMLPVALWVCLGLRGGRAMRSTMTVLCVSTLIGPALARVVLPTDSASAWSVFEMVWYLTQPQRFVELHALVGPLATVAGVSAALWVLGLAMVRAPDKPAKSLPTGYDGQANRDWSI